jgi:hypothetical protein
VVDISSFRVLPHPLNNYSHHLLANAIRQCEL